MEFQNKVLILLLVVAAVSLISCQTEETEFYPDRWYQLDIKGIIDNERLFKKYKACYITNNTAGCPRIAMEVKEKAPEIIATLCSKCKPEHVDAGRLAMNYTCMTRRKDFDEMVAYYDPDGTVLPKAEAKFGKLACY